MTFSEAEKFRFNPFDLTKIWPHKDYPLIPVGRFVLNKNPQNYFAEVSCHQAQQIINNKALINPIV